jgi:hypothetical protein
MLGRVAGAAARAAQSAATKAAASRDRRRARRGRGQDLDHAEAAQDVGMGGWILTGHADHGEIGSDETEFLRERGAVDFGHGEIGEDEADAGVGFGEEAEGDGAGGGGEHGVADVFEQMPEGGEHGGLVVDDENGSGLRGGVGVGCRGEGGGGRSHGVGSR